MPFYRIFNRYLLRLCSKAVVVAVVSRELCTRQPCRLNWDIFWLEAADVEQDV